MTTPLSVEDGLSRGELQFAIVQTFNPVMTDSDPEEEGPGDNGSGDMTGTLRLMDGTVLPFAYADGRWTTREPDDFGAKGAAHFDETGKHPGTGRTGFSWPHYGAVLMVEVQDGRVRRWTWPFMVLTSVYGVKDISYLQIPIYDNDVTYEGLHCLVDLTQLDLGQAEELILEHEHDFPHPAVYVGHHADDFLRKAQAPYAYAVFHWEPTGRYSHATLVGLEAK